MMLYVISKGITDPGLIYIPFQPLWKPVSFSQKKQLPKGAAFQSHYK